MFVYRWKPQLLLLLLLVPDRRRGAGRRAPLLRTPARVRVLHRERSHSRVELGSLVLETLAQLRELLLLELDVHRLLLRAVSVRLPCPPGVRVVGLPARARGGRRESAAG